MDRLGAEDGAVEVTLRRSAHTVYQTRETQIYAFKRQYFILEACQQGQVLLPQHGPAQLASEFSGLSSSHDLTVSASALGSAVRVAIENFDTRPHPFDEYDLAARHRAWLGARGIASVEKNSRVVQVVMRLADRSIAVIPFDKHRRDSWCGPMEDQIIVLPASADPACVGTAVLQAFRVATDHPQRTAPIDSTQEASSPTRRHPGHSTSDGEGGRAGGPPSRRRRME